MPSTPLSASPPRRADSLPKEPGVAIPPYEIPLPMSAAPPRTPANRVYAMSENYPWSPSASQETIVWKTYDLGKDASAPPTSARLGADENSQPWQQNEPPAFDAGKPPPSPPLPLNYTPPSPVYSQTETYIDERTRIKLRNGQTWVFKFIPSRIGTAIFAALMFLCALGMAIGGALIANKLQGHTTPLQTLGLIFQIFNYLFVAVASTFGLYAIARVSRRACQLFCGLLLGHLPFALASGFLSIHIVFKATNSVLIAGIAAGEAAANEGDTQATLSARGGSKTPTLACSVLEGTNLYGLCRETKLVKGLVIVLYLVLWFLEIIAFYAGNKYSNQLQALEEKVKDEEADLEY